MGILANIFSERLELKILDIAKLRKVLVQFYEKVLTNYNLYKHLSFNLYE